MYGWIAPLHQPAMSCALYKIVCANSLISHDCMKLVVFIMLERANGSHVSTYKDPVDVPEHKTYSRANSTSSVVVSPCPSDVNWSTHHSVNMRAHIIMARPHWAKLAPVSRKSWQRQWPFREFRPSSSAAAIICVRLNSVHRISRKRVAPSLDTYSSRVILRSPRDVSAHLYIVQQWCYRASRDLLQWIPTNFGKFTGWPIARSCVRQWCSRAYTRREEAARPCTKCTQFLYDTTAISTGFRI